MDLPTSYGTRPLSPFWWRWFAVDWMPIIDVYLLAVLSAGLWLGRRRRRLHEPSHEARRQRWAMVALALMAGNYAIRAASHHTAVAGARDVFGARLPEWCERSSPPSWAIDYWPRFPEIASRDRTATRCLVELAAMPSFASPFRWRLIAQLSNGYEVREVDLLDSRVSDERALERRRQSVFVPNQWTPAVETAARAPTPRVFLGFSRFPAARSVVAEDGTATVRWTDLRFIQGDLDDPRQPRRGLFGATVVVAADGRVVEDRLGP
jgi:hypothetical protein